MKRATEFVLGPKTRASYVHLLEKTSVDGGKPHYSSMFLIRKDDRQEKLKISNELLDAMLVGVKD